MFARTTTILALIMTFGALPLSAPASAAINDFVGTWRNTDSDTRGMTRVVIARAGQGLRVQGFGSCSPRDCDWGRVRAAAYGPGAGADLGSQANSAIATFRFDFKETMLVLTKAGSNTLRYCTYDRYTDGSGRSNARSCGSLRKAARVSVRPAEPPRVRPTPARPAVPATPPRVRPAPRTYKTGGINIRQTWLADLDNGTEGSSSGADIWFQAKTATDRYITPRNGAKIGIAGTRSIGRDGCMGLRMGTRSIPLSRVPQGTYVCVLTNEGRYSQFRVNAPVGRSPGVLKIGFTTWERI